MPDLIDRPEIDVPAKLTPFVSRLEPGLGLVELWLFGSRARGDERGDSDWDLLAVVPDAAPEAVTEPLFAWQIARTSEVPVTLLVTRQADLEAIWARPNTIGYDLAHEGVRLRVR